MMPDSGYPLSIYNYRVTINKDGDSVTFAVTQVSGLSMQYEPVTYKHGLSFVMGNKIIPGMGQPTKITMKRGIIQDRDYLHQWIDKTYSDPFYTEGKRDILIDLCNAEGTAVIQWCVQKAMPIKLDAPDFDVNSNEVAFESMEFIAHGLTVNYDP